MNASIIESKVDEFVGRGQGFTSVDICNSIKTDGTWIRNREVASWLRRWTPPVGYGVSKVSVTLGGGGTATASVYLPNTMAVGDYAATAQEAMTPAQFEDLHGYDPTASTSDDGVVATVVTPDDGSDGGDGSQDDAVGVALRKMFNFPDA